MKLLLHCCCLVCSIKTIEELKKNFELTLYWFNPNIHPYKEYAARLEALKDYAKTLKLNLIVEDFYGLRYFIKNINNNFNERCLFCYETRLLKTATFAKENGFSHFSTTLTYSPFQNHELIKKIAEKISKELKINFVYEDLRKFYREGQQKAREIGLYMQKYCGCIFSEQERYLKKWD